MPISTRVIVIFLDCLFRDGENRTEFIRAPGILHSVGFHPGRIAGYKDEIAAMLAELPPEFQEKTGGGWSFLNACQDDQGRLWTGSHLIMEQLFQLGEAIGKVKPLVPREAWDKLPGGMPYYVVTEDFMPVTPERSGLDSESIRVPKDSG